MLGKQSNNQADEWTVGIFSKTLYPNEHSINAHLQKSGISPFIPISENCFKPICFLNQRISSLFYRLKRFSIFFQKWLFYNFKAEIRCYKMCTFSGTKKLPRAGIQEERPIQSSKISNAASSKINLEFSPDVFSGLAKLFKNDAILKLKQRHEGKVYSKTFAIKIKS